MQRFARIAGAILGILFVSITAALADDWVAVKLRGEVVQLVGDQWLPLQRNDVVSDDRAVRTGFNGHVVFQRDAETVELSPSTQIRIHDRVGERFTVVEEHFGTVTVEAEVQNVQHFAVETPFLAAVVKGTKFSVKTNKAASTVKVTRGSVAVEARADGSKVLITAGQSASTSPTSPTSVTSPAASEPVLGVSGLGDLPEIVEGTGEVVDNLVEDLVGDLLFKNNHGNHGLGDNGHHGEGNSGHGGSGGSSGGSGSGGSGGSGGGGLVGGLLGRLL